MKKIAHLLLLDSLGGVENWYIDLAKNNFFEYHSATVFAIGRNKDKQVIEKLSAFVKVVEVPTSSLGQTLSFFRKSKPLLKSFDYVYNHGYFRSFQVLLFFKLFSKAKIATHNHSAAFTSIINWKYKLLAVIARFIINALTSIKVAVSQKAAIDLFYTTKNVHIIHCRLKKHENLKPKNYTPKTTEKVQLSHMGRFYSSNYFLDAKNQGFIIEILKKLESIGFQYQMSFYGGGDTSAVRAKMQKIRVPEDRVNFVEFAESKDALEQTDIFLFPSNHEGFGLALYEAQLAGVFCIASIAISQEAIPCKDLVVQLPIDEESVELWSQQIINYKPINETISVKLEPFKSHIDEIHRLFK